MDESLGNIFRNLVKHNPPLQVLGTVNAYAAMLAKSLGARALYISGAGVSNASYGLPDLGMTSLNDVLEDVKRITDAVPNIPILVDIDTGWGSVLNIERTIKLMEKSRVAAVHIEDQPFIKRCGHRPNKNLISKEKMGDRIKAAVDARSDSSFVIMARTDAFGVTGMEDAILRAQYYVELGADMIFAESLSSIEDYKNFTQNIKVPILANMTEFGKTPLLTLEELKQAGLGLILYPLSAFRAMSKACENVYRAILYEGSQKSCLISMQNREELYNVLNYYDFEKKLE